jgi:hypothetical protein
MIVVGEDRTFVLKDNEGNFVGKNSIYCNREFTKCIYSYSEFLTNGFYTYQRESDAKEYLKSLQTMALKIKIGIEFHIEEINRIEVLMLESKKNIPKNPFVQKDLEIGLAIA